MRWLEVVCEADPDQSVASRLCVAACCGLVIVSAIQRLAWPQEPNPPKPADALKATLSLDQVISGMHTLHDAFGPSKSFRLAYRQDVVSFDHRGQPQPTYWTEADYARKQDMIRSDIQQVVPARPDGVSDMKIYWKDGVCAERRGNGLGITGFLTGQAHNYFFYTDALFVDVYRQLEWGSPQRLKEHDGLTLSECMFFLLPRMIEDNREEYQLLPDLEEVDGSLCHVVHWPGRDKIWVDPEHSFLVRKRQFLDGGLVLSEWANGDLTQCENGIWLPKEQTETHYYGPGAPEDRQGTVNKSKRTTLQSVSFAELPDEFFDIEIPDDQRIVVNDSVRGMAYQKHPKGTDAAEQVLEDVGGLPPWTRTRESETRTRWALSNGIILGIVGIWWLSRGLRRPKK